MVVYFGLWWLLPPHKHIRPSSEYSFEFPPASLLLGKIGLRGKRNERSVLSGTSGFAVRCPEGQAAAPAAVVSPSTKYKIARQNAGLRPADAAGAVRSLNSRKGRPSRPPGGHWRAAAHGPRDTAAQRATAASGALCGGVRGVRGALITAHCALA